MMETIRTAANNIFVKIIFAIIILCFIFTGVGFLGFSGGNSPRDQQLYIAKVDGEGISRAEFEAQARAVTAKAGGDSSFIKQLRRNVLSHQIDNYLAYKFSQRIGVAISNDQIKNFIKEQRDFFKNGKFDNQTYLNLLAENHFTPDSYAEIIRSVLQQQQLVNAITNSGFVLPIDSEISSLKNQVRQVYSALIDPSVVNMDDVKITLEDEQKYYNEHQKQFFKKERVKIKYIVNSTDDLIKKIKVSNEEIKQEFNQNIKKYTFPAKKSYSAIYVIDKEQADSIVKELTSGRDFESIVEIVNQDNNISPYGKNGFLGWFVDDDSLPRVFKDARLKKVGQVSAPIQADGGYVIVKLDGLQKAKVMDFDYAKYQIESKIKQQKLQESFEAVEHKIKANLKEPIASIEELSEKTGLKLYTPDWAFYNDRFSILYYPEVKDVVFSEEMIADGKVNNKLSDMIFVDNAQSKYDFVIQLVDYRPEGIAPFEEVQEEIRNKLYTDIANNRFKTTIDGFLSDLNQSGKNKNVQFVKSYKLTRHSKDIDEKVVSKVFDLLPSASGKNVYGVAFINDKSAYVLAMAKVETPAYEDISSELLPLFINHLHYYLAADIRSKAKIEIMPDANL
jgi:peptidyl-prolyl cis-trans isomerase D